MKKGLRIAILAGAACALVLLIILIMGLNRNRKHMRTCSGVNVELADGYSFVTAEDIVGYLTEEYGAYIGQQLDSVDLAKVERILNGKSAILKTEAYTTPDGKLNVKVFQREPTVRFQKGDKGFYADEKGFLFPLQSNYTSKVPIIDGAVPLTFESGYKGKPVTEEEAAWLGKIITLVNYMNSSKNWAEIISQITVRPDGDLVMVPRKGKELFIFGQPDNLEEKFTKMEKYYTTILPEKGEGFYSTVNLKYNGQIICRK